MSQGAAIKADLDDLVRLRDNLAMQKLSVQESGRAGFFDLDEEFHRLIARSADRQAAWDAVELVTPKMDRVRFLDLEGHHSQEINIAERTAIVDAIEERDASRAEEVMKKHLRTINNALLRIRAHSQAMFDDE